MNMKQTSFVADADRRQPISRPVHLGLALVLLCIANFLVALDFSIVNVALPSIKTALSFSQDGLQWVISAYALPFGGLLLLAGRAADLYGRRRLFIAGLVLFALGSLIAGLSSSSGILIAARALQGIGAATLAPAALSILTTTFQEGKERQRALGIYLLVTSAGFVSGIIAGGIIVQVLNWHWIFYVNVPIAIGTALCAPLLLRESHNHEAARRLDIPGAFFITASVVLVVYTMSQANSVGWLSFQTLGSFTAALLLGGLFVLVESRVADPMVPLSFFRQRIIMMANLAGLLLLGSLASMLFVLTLFLQQVLHYNPLQTGLTLIPQGIAAVIAGLVAARLSARFSVGSLLIFGAFLQTVATVLLMFLLQQGGLVFLEVAIVMFGFGDILAFVMVSIQATTGVSDEDQGLAGGMLTMAQQVGAGLGLAVTVAIATARTNSLLPKAQQAAPPLYALVSGFQYALGAAALMTAIATLIGIMLSLQGQQERKMK
ncbi:MAG TPA: MFS transporter [Ktedonobacteraceae bacterium]|nr:MFS transporter [Ktedonobacteraceae bacterium]